MLVPQLSEYIKSGSSSYLECLDAASNIVNTWNSAEKALFVNSHPRIGQVSGLSSLSAAEQAAQKTPENVLQRLNTLNNAYENKFPKLRFITFVNGRTRAEIVPEIEHLLALTNGTQEFGTERWNTELQRDLDAIWLIAKARTEAANLSQRVDYAPVHLERWRSRVTGLSVAQVKHESPMCEANFVVPTEIFDDSGCPHTLEHLVFLGSKLYPYKGVLDTLANRAFAAGTNAWTDTDQTVYTLQTAGYEGFLRMLPVYMDHLLRPTITDAGYTTEIHHINESGDDAGVVYSEMQGRSTSPFDLMEDKQRGLIYPKNSAYRSETGGRMEALRVLTADKVRDFHKKYYAPHNLSLVVTGDIPTDKLLDVMQNVIEPRIISDAKERGIEIGVKPRGWKRPFVETPSAEPLKLQKTERAVAEFPEQDESVGEVELSWVGGKTNDFLHTKALDILGTYLTDSAISPLQKHLVEIASPYCTDINIYNRERVCNDTIHFNLASVPTTEIDNVEGKLMEILNNIVKEGFDMDRMALVLKRDRVKLLDMAERQAASAFAYMFIADHLYGDAEGKDLQDSLAEMKRCDILSQWTSDDWAQLLKKSFIDAPFINVKGKPSATLAKTLEENEQKRLDEQRRSLGEEGIKKAKKVFDDAQVENNKEIPDDMIKSFEVPSTDSISWIPIESARQEYKKASITSPTNNELRKHIESDPSKPPIFVQYDHGKSSFTSIRIYLSTNELPKHLRPYASLFLSTFFSLPVKRRDGTMLSHEAVVRSLDETTLEHDINFGSRGTFAELLQVSVKVEKQYYEASIEWLSDLLTGSVFDVERLKVTAAKIQQGLPEQKREGDTVVWAMSTSLMFDSLQQANAVLEQSEFNPTVIKRLEDDPKGVISDLEEFRRCVVQPNGIRVSVAGNVMGLERPQEPWAKYFPEENNKPLASVPWVKDFKLPLGQNPSKKAVVVPLPSIESSFSVHTAKGVEGYDHPDIPALMVTLGTLNALESYLWRYIRGTGLAYGASITQNPESGLMMFTVYKAPNAFRAYEEGGKVVKGLVDGSIALEDTTLESSISSLCFSMTSREATIGSAALSSFVNQIFKQVPQDYNKQLLAKFREVKKEDVMDVLRRYIAPLFNADTSSAVIVSGPSKVEGMEESLRKEGFDVERRTLDVEDVEDSDGSASE
ncbi:hypothetical protein E3P94_02416 [Wallemia ichthyophaga]|nr:hypothetical protein E3P96_03653 [Wallemia ichthyophaga]TIA97370.1 hypothetical protein E3P95_02852 [Wallemia ichthyophaga]TIA99888.1 hypothetical protein E3P94_02416 [Wallemia ichthyophaga]